MPSSSAAIVSKTVGCAFALCTGSSTHTLHFFVSFSHTSLFTLHAAFLYIHTAADLFLIHLKLLQSTYPIMETCGRRYTNIVQCAWEAGILPTDVGRYLYNGSSTGLVQRALELRRPAADVQRVSGPQLSSNVRRNLEHLPRPSSNVHV